MDATAGGCCIARLPGGSYAYDTSNTGRRFRPIAPKPTAGSSVSPPANGAVGSLAKTGRSGKRRRYTKSVNKNSYCTNNIINSTNRKRKASSSSRSAETIVTLPLLPDTPVTGKRNTGEAVWLRFEEAAGRRRTVESWVTVEQVTEACVDIGEGLGSTDEERRMNLERDTCPGFESDGVGRVRWMNTAYRRLVGQGEWERNEEVNMMLWVVIKKKAGVVITYSPAAFTCTVRMRYTCRNQMTSMTVPCDVWRMDDGGFAWRLDVKAALTLSLAP